ncbi:MAG: hypothetical protein DMF53_22720 [Acidobacteria bacterium]|nr:MAG: hypothetical protein DMF53_22720 [Acidobacteriota bacterium]
MRKSKEGIQEGKKTALDAARGRILARVLSEDLRAVRGEDQSPMTVDATRTDPPPGYDITFIGSDSSI